MKPPVCPAATPISSDEGPAVVCGVKRDDAERGDTILEGSGTGVVVTARRDPSTYFGFCYGDGTPGHPDDDPPPCHYTGCPIWAAGKEIDTARRIWKFEKPEDPREAERRLAEELGLEVTDPAGSVPTNRELGDLFGIEVGK